MTRLVQIDKTSTPYLPEVHVRLTGTNGNAFAVMGKVRGAMRKAGYGEHIGDFLEEAMAGDYDHLLRTCMRWVDVS